MTARSRYLLSLSSASATRMAVPAVRAIPVGGALGGLQGAKLEMEI
jgi:hypothetical protein